MKTCLNTSEWKDCTESYWFHPALCTALIQVTQDRCGSDTCGTKKKTDEKDFESDQLDHAGETHSKVDVALTSSSFTAASSYFMNSNTTCLILLLPATREINKSGGRPCELIWGCIWTQTTPLLQTRVMHLFIHLSWILQFIWWKQPDFDVISFPCILYTAFI